MKIKLRTIAKLLVIILLFSTTAYTAYAAERGDHHHSTDTDTTDYCLSVYDVRIGLSECRDNGWDLDKVRDIIIERADPIVLVRDVWTSSFEWRRLSVDELSFDFSSFKQEINDQGYTVTVTAPAITLEKDSKISFKVFVTDDTPRVYATIHFLETDIRNKKIDITDGGTISVDDVETPKKDGYKFIGWYLDKECTKPFLLPGSKNYREQKVTGDLKLYPKWEKAKVYATIQFLNSDLKNMKIDITHGATVSIKDLDLPVKEGYVFEGWYLDRRYTKPFLLPNDERYQESVVIGNIAAYGKWRRESQAAPAEDTPAPAQPAAPVQPAVKPQDKPALESSLPEVHEDSGEQQSQPQPEVTVNPSSTTEVTGQNIPAAVCGNDSGKHPVTPRELAVLALFSAISIGMGYSIAGDVHVLRWYRKQKNIRKAK